MYGEGRIAGVIEIFKRGFSFCERTGAFSLIKTKELLVAEGAIHAVRLKQKSKTKRKENHRRNLRIPGRLRRRMGRNIS
ncbi:MAG: hypothetical protein ACLR1V_17020 [Coprococcus sp.]